MPFGDLEGHNRIVSLLARSVARDSLPPSLLFTGPSTVVSAAALAVAQAVNCQSRLTTDDSRLPTDERRLATDACGRCSACVRIARGMHPDVLVIEPGETGTIKIEQVRDAVERSAYRPFEGRRRVVIVRDAEALVPQAQNALLKTLEEPPPSSMFILLTALPDMLLPTVRSRLIRLAFAEGGAEETDEEARAVAARVLAQAASAPDPGRRLETARELLAGTGAGGAADREQLALHLRAIASMIRDVEVLATGADAGLLAHPDVRTALDRLVPAFRGDRGARAFAAVEEALGALGGNAGVKVVADWVVTQL